jgi:hypothetical protein
VAIVQQPLLGSSSADTFPRRENKQSWKRCFLCGPYNGYVTRTSNSWSCESCVEAGSNTSTVTLRVVGGDKKGSLKCETVKYGHESQRTRTRERLRWQGPAAGTNDRAVLSSERAPHKKQDCNCQTVINIRSRAPDGARHQDLLTGWPSVAMWLWIIKSDIWMEGQTHGHLRRTGSC